MTNDASSSAKRDNRNDELAYRRDRTYAEAKAARKALAEGLAANKRFSEWDAEALAKADSAAVIWHQVDALADGTGNDLVWAVAHVAADLQRSLLNQMHASRSTSVFGNAFEDAKRDATVAFLRDYSVQWAMREQPVTND